MAIIRKQFSTTSGLVMQTGRHG